MNKKRRSVSFLFLAATKGMKKNNVLIQNSLFILIELKIKAGHRRSKLPTFFVLI